MLTAEQVSFFRGFGFVVVDDLVEHEVLDNLAVEVTSALDGAFGADPETQLQGYLAHRGGPRSGAVLGQYLPIMSPSTPRSLALAESDNLVQAAQQLLDSNTVIAKPAKAVRYVNPSGWHCDGKAAMRAAKVIYYLESAAEITFELVPASHLAPVERVVKQLLGEKGDRTPEESAPVLPTVTVGLKREQALFFDVALWHRNPSSSERTQWSMTYITGPESAEDIYDTVSFIGSFFGKHPSYDQQRYPFFPASWIDGSSDSVLSEYLDKSGVMEQFVERFGEHL